MAKRLSISLANREVIKNKLLAGVNDDAKVGCIFDCNDLTSLVNALRGFPFKNEHQAKLLDDLLELRFAAFDVPRRV